MTSDQTVFPQSLEERIVQSQADIRQLILEATLIGGLNLTCRRDEVIECGSVKLHISRSNAVLRMFWFLPEGLAEAFPTMEITFHKWGSDEKFVLQFRRRNMEEGLSARTPVGVKIPRGQYGLRVTYT